MCFEKVSMIEKPLKKTLNNELSRLSVLFLINECAEFDIKKWYKPIQNGVVGWIFRDNGIFCGLKTKKHVNGSRAYRSCLALWLAEEALYFKQTSIRDD
ncbi:hypothetical protein ACROAK_06630 [Shewanella oncorhynchi]|uniref:hypothetical protein n=1 Tax=Shewanella oncorhynchi TaxID=2726434 RepID=UPI003D790682